MTETKTALQSPRNQKWKKFSKEIEKINKLLLNIPTEKITE